MAVERVPGEEMYIDWVGDQPFLLLEPDTGEIRKVHFFATTLGVSSLIYAEA
jgi:transposase